MLTIDAHTGGEPLRIILNGHPELPSPRVLDARRFVRDHHDDLRKLLMWEPRGHADMYGCLVTGPETEGADCGVIFLHNEGYSTMCGHGIIALTKVLLETGVLPQTAPVTEVRIDTPAGLVTAHGYVHDGFVDRVSFENVPSYVVGLDDVVQVPDVGDVRYDLAFGGAFYAIVDAGRLGLELSASNLRALIDAGMSIKRTITGQREIVHPLDDDLGFLYGTIFVWPGGAEGVHSRNVCVFAEGEVDRSPTGTGVSARAAIHYARGEIGLGEWIEIESIVGSRFRVRVKSESEYGGHPAIIPEVEGTAHITGRHEFVLDPADPLQPGFFLR